MIEVRVGAKLDCASVVVATQQLMQTLLSLDAIQKDADLISTGTEYVKVFMISVVLFCSYVIVLRLKMEIMIAVFPVIMSTNHVSSS